MPEETVVALFRDGKSLDEIAGITGLSLSRLRGLRFKHGFGKPRKVREKKPAPTKVETPEFSFARVLNCSDSVIKQRVRKYCTEQGIDNRCVVRQATDDERREFGI